MWQYLEGDYYVTTNDSCGTHVHVSFIGGWTLPNLKRVCQSIIYFEPAIEAMLPETRLGNEYSKSNWIDNASLGRKNLSRQQSIEAIQKCSNMRDLVLLMNPPHEGNHDKMFGWNLLYLLSSPNGTVEFRRGSGSSSVEEAFMWAEFAIAFVMAAIRVSTPWTNMTNLPDLGGLQNFLQSAVFAQAATPFRPEYLHRLSNKKNLRARREPRPLGVLSPEKARKLNQKKAEDEKKNVILTKVLKPAYWQ